MATLLLVLLLGSVGSCVGSLDTHLQQVCDGHTRPGSVVQPPQCPEPPCHTATTTLTLALPLLLTLDTDTRDEGPELQVYNTAGDGCGLVMVRNTPNYMILWGATCGGLWHSITLPHSPASGGVHVEVVTEGQQVKLYLQGHKDAPLTLTCQAHLPSVVKVSAHTSTFGYSAATTTTTTHHSVFFYLGVIALVIVVVVVVYVVVVVVTANVVMVTLGCIMKIFRGRIKSFLMSLKWKKRS